MKEKENIGKVAEDQTSNKPSPGKRTQTQNYSTTVSVKMHYYHFCWLLFYGKISVSILFPSSSFTISFILCHFISLSPSLSVPFPFSLLSFCMFVIFRLFVYVWADVYNLQLLLILWVEFSVRLETLITQNCVLKNKMVDIKLLPHK